MEGERGKKAASNTRGEQKKNITAVQKWTEHDTSRLAHAPCIQNRDDDCCVTEATTRLAAEATR